MNCRFVVIIFVSFLTTSSCDFFNGKIDRQMKQLAKEESRVADSLKEVIIKERPRYEDDPLFKVKMDTVYSSGFKLALLADSLLIKPNNKHIRNAYKAEMNIFRNYVNKNFDYSDNIASTMLTLDLGTKFKEEENSGSIPYAVDMMYGMIKPGIMQIIMDCRSQHSGREVAEGDSI